ncbi:primase-helicase family protein [Gluconobacter frateurii]|uniref:NrS-1 polymerase-like helicase domain-containing protein n=1 Tax=Gluconobacter frateurii NRIC 0228 TaxID=1307946 RepID=A0ABQ0QFQ3_9PROT|nr:primase-helicase family protein [Gluconobacter frateurii]GBR17512.1 hypothetical protein AA0228_3046 [Gluconobacter frateurii NRIC 0228]GLP89624.1 hypothetical protein GCM10007868_06990 [Gluconobacter frateurii]
MKRQIRKQGIARLDTNVFNDTVVRSNEDTMLSSFYDYLSTKIFEVEGTSRYYFWNENKNRNEEVSGLQPLIRKATYIFANNKNHMVDGLEIPANVISNYCLSPIMTVKSDMKLPLAGPVAKYEGSYFINSFEDRSIVPEDTILNDDDEFILSSYLPLLCRGNFGLDYDITLDQFLEIVIGHRYQKNSKEHLIAYFFNWIAGIYQRPGISYPTVPCFFGRVQGTGKGFMVSIIDKILGNCVPNYSQEKTDSKFNNITDGKLLIVYNEVDKSKNFYNNIIKSENSEETRIVEGKGKDSKKVINITNSILCSNKLAPFSIDQGDRRLVIIQTMSVSDSEIQKFKENMIKTIEILGGDSNASINIANSLVKIIACCPIEKSQSDFYQAIRTSAKELLEESYKAPIDRFFADSEVDFFNIKDTKSVAKRTSIKTLEELYSKWSINNDEESGLSNVNSKYGKTKSSFRQDIKVLSQENKNIKTANKGYEFTDDFYDWFIEERSNVVPFESNQQRDNDTTKAIKNIIGR